MVGRVKYRILNKISHLCMKFPLRKLFVGCQLASADEKKNKKDPKSTWGEGIEAEACQRRLCSVHGMVLRDKYRSIVQEDGGRVEG